VVDSVVSGSFDAVGVVTCSFDDSRVGSVSSACGASFVDFCDGVGECLLPAVRGKSPPAL